MRLINTSTLVIHDFIDATHAPWYAILSHCWGDDEVSFKDFTKRRNLGGAGYRKIVDCCAFALQRRWDWVWIDTCCIDKRSSAELSEAINSMFEWYQLARECYAYLGDVTAEPANKVVLLDQIVNSRWFTRGWTLQELIAPRSVVFVTANWAVAGDKSIPGTATFWPISSAESYLTSKIERITGVPAEVLCDVNGMLLQCVSVAQRLSWIANRKTTRQEDMAYCVLGLLGINMPLLYGEGKEAFIRLQMEIVSRTGDESVFAWHSNSLLPAVRLTYGVGIFAETPDCFQDAGSVIEVTTIHDRSPCSMSGRGVEVRFPQSQRNGAFHHRNHRDRYLLRLNCARATGRPREPASPCVIYLKQARCGHFNRSLGSEIQDENHVECPEDWMPIAFQHTLYIHASQESDCTRNSGIQQSPVSFRLPSLAEAVL